ncbi:hypothetical protein M1563_02915 [Patescibacteria group bacterium]|nr:hypothetical protein [Patescibacteria group bacterium]
MKDIKLLSRQEYERWLKTLPRESCTLCEWGKYQIVLKEMHFWVWIACLAPYRKFHTMFIPKRHIESIGELIIWEWLELVRLYQYALWRFRELDITDRYLIFWRKRDSYIDSKTGTRKLTHLHIHFIPDREHCFDPILDSNAIRIDNIEKLIQKISSHDQEEKEGSWHYYLRFFGRVKI